MHSVYMDDQEVFIDWKGVHSIIMMLAPSQRLCIAPVDAVHAVGFAFALFRVYIPTHPW